MDYDHLLLCLILLLIPFIYWYSTRAFRYWSKRGVKGPRPWPFIGNLMMFLKSDRKQEIELLKKFGSIYGNFNGNSPVLTVAEPELVKNILVKDFNIFIDRPMFEFIVYHPILSKHLGFMTGQDWKRVRSIVSPTFSSGKMKKMYPMIKYCMNEFLGVLHEYATNGRPVNMKDMFGNYTMDVIATCAFATKTNAHKDPNDPFVKNAIKVFTPDLFRVIPLLFLPKFLINLFKMKSFIEESANEFFFNITRHVISERKNSRKTHNDFIQLLLNAQKIRDNNKEVMNREDNDMSESHHVNEGEEERAVLNNVFSSVNNKFITEDEILAQAWVFLNAGYETTATTLTFASYELALNPVVQQRLYEEVITAFDTKGDIDFETLSGLPYLDSVVSETLRLYSSLLRLTRIASEDYKLGTTGITIKKGTTVEIPVYAIHYCEDFYEYPEKFNPDRFMPENKHKLIPYTYLPFGVGPRNCIGMRFALMEAKLCLAQVIKNFKLIRSPQTDVPPLYKYLPGFNSPTRLIIEIEKRT